jgi:hypothetical protein
MNGSNTITSPNGQFTLAVTDTGITLSGPGGSITLSATAISLEAGSIALGSGEQAVLRAGDVFVAADGSPITVVPSQNIVRA